MPDGELRWEPVTAERLAGVWPTVRDGLVEAVRSDRHRPLIEDVYCAIRLGRAELLLATQNDCYRGALVMQVDVNPFGGAHNWYVWLVTASAYAGFRAGLDALKPLAKTRGYSAITFRSPRDGWGRAIHATPIETLYKIEV